MGTRQFSGKGVGIGIGAGCGFGIGWGFGGAPIGLLGMGIGGGCGVGIGLGYGFGYAVGAQYINVAPDFAERKHQGNPNVIQQLQHQLDRLLHKDNADAGQT
ncbi:TPA: hypothetical protein ACH3X1_007539 [Trebouxia sp. C0004]